MMGAYNISRKIEPGRITTRVKSIQINQKWDPLMTQYSGDLAILKLIDRVTVSEFVNPICIGNIQISHATSGVVTGWGIYDNTNIPSEVPRKLEISIINDLECLQNNPGLLHIFSNNSFCAGRIDAGVCRGDSGSGFYVQQNGKYYLRGVVSSSTFRQCSDSNVAIYSDVLENAAFIKKVIIC